MKKILLIAGLSLIFFTACKKNKPADDVATTPPVTTIPTTGTALDLMKDSVYLYAKEDYYWYNSLPDYNTVAPRAITGADDITALQNVVNKISQYAKNATTGLPYEYSTRSPGTAKYSFIDDGTASARLNAIIGDFGFSPGFNPSNKASTDLRVYYVYPNSPADKAGVKRGDQITNINGQTNLTNTSQSSIDFIINAYEKSSTITMGLKRTADDGSTSTLNVSLNTATYTVNPIITTKVITTGAGKKVGYMVFNSFVKLASVQSALDAAFNNFVTSGINDLVVDLRYDGGGYVETSEYLANLIAPTSANGQVMYTTYYNDVLSANKEALLKNQVRRDDNGKLYTYADIDYSVNNTYNPTKFSKAGSLNLNRVFFLVGNGTASASELTINNLRPYMNVQLIGDVTYGKPVGFFDININKYTMYIPEFETKNSLSQGGYYTGMTPGVGVYTGKSAADDVTKDFGNINETLLKQALNFIDQGVYINSAALQVQSTESAAGIDLNSQLNNRKFNGMIFEKPRLK